MFLALGCYAAILQVVVIRECFLLFSGNELSIALQLGVWLCLTAAGGAVGALLPRSAARPLLVLLPLTGLWALLALRGAPVLLPLPLGHQMPLGRALAALLAALLPLNLVAGALFPAGCGYFAREREGSAIGRFYMIEALGACAGGAVFTLVLAGAVPGTLVVFLASAGAALIAALAFWRGSPVFRAVSLIVALASLSFAFVADPMSKLDDIRWRRSGSERLATLETKYERLDLGYRQGQHTVYANGVPHFALEDTQESASPYRLADLLLSLHSDPQAILILGSGEPGLVARVLEHPVQHVDYALLDSAVIGLTRAAGPQRLDWDHPKLRVVPGDGRAFLADSRRQHDLIILDLPAPTTAAGNRFFTVQAFQLAAARLAPGGVFVFQLPSSGHYLAGEAETLLASVHGAMEQAFDDTHLLAGDSMIFVGGLPGKLPSLEDLSERFAQRGVAITLEGGRRLEDPTLKQFAFQAFHEPFFNEFRRQQQVEGLQQASAAVNDDAQPVAYYLNLRRSLQEAGFPRASIDRVCRAAETVAEAARRNWAWAILIVAAGVVCLSALPHARRLVRRRVLRRTTLVVAMLASGWAGMLGELILVYTYQNLFGQVYHAIGLLFATYMIGLVAGSAIATSGRAARAPGGAWLLATRGGMLLSCALMAALWRMSNPLVFFLIAFLYALALGLEYPVANRVYREDEQGRHAAGVLHAADHFGAAFAALLGGTVAIPLLGTHGALAIIAGVHGLVLALLVCVIRESASGA